MKNRIALGILSVFLLIASASFGMFSENSRQGSDPIFSITDQGIQLLNPAPDLGSEGNGSENRVRVNNLAKVLTPFLFQGRRWESLSQTYNHRNRFMNPKYGRFTSRDPIGFEGDLNLYRFAKNNPLRYSDPTGKVPAWIVFSLILQETIALKITYDYYSGLLVPACDNLCPGNVALVPAAPPLSGAHVVVYKPHLDESAIEVFTKYGYIQFGDCAYGLKAK